MDAIILGGGIAGLTAAYRLKQKGYSVLLLEKGNRWGGCIQSVRQNDALLEKGPNSFLGSHETILQTAKELGLQEQLIEASPAAKNRYIYSKGRLHPFPKSPAGFLKTPLLNPFGKIRLLLEPWVSRTVSGEESVAAFVTRRLGRQALNLVEPMINGIYAGDARCLSLQAIAPTLAKWEKEYGSLFKALRQSRLLSQGNKIYSFKNGLQTLADGLHQQVADDSFLGCQDIRISKTGDGWCIKWKRGASPYEAHARHLILGVPAQEAASLLLPIDAKLSNILNEIFYAPLAVVHLLAKRSTLHRPLDGFGFLAGADERSPLLGCLWSSATFENRCNDDSSVLLTCFVGGAKNPNILEFGSDQIFDMVLKELRQVFGAGRAVEEIATTCYAKGLPQYTLGHRERVGEIQTHLRNLKGLYAVGNYLDGISVNDVMTNAAGQVEAMYHAD